ncbi:M14 metallopeptidase family protein [Candidatus Latescibacterota bacterium]
MTESRRIKCILVLILLIVITAEYGSAQEIPSPESYLGYQVGADFRLAGSEKIIKYFNLVGDASSRVRVRSLGESTLGRPLIIAEITDNADDVTLERIMESRRMVHDPRLIATKEDEDHLVESEKVVLFINCSLHASEIAATQMSMELLYELATENTQEFKDILSRVVIVLVPMANPDGIDRVIEWYNESRDTPWEGTGMPYLYHHYAGHDTNRDWFMLNLEETRLETSLIYDEWLPTVLYDIHQMGNQTARFFVPPFFDPKNPNVHPLNDDMLMIIGGHMAAALTRAGKTGILHSAMYDNWWQGGFRTTVYRHNMVGILTEAASVNIASPVFQRRSELRGGPRGMPSYSLTTNFPEPWPGGWWRLRNIVEYEKHAIMSLLNLMTAYHDLFQSNTIMMAREAIEKGTDEPPYAWLVPPSQSDPATSASMLERLHATGIEVHRAVEDFTADGIKYPAGTFILFCAQPFRNHLNDMMEAQKYPDRSLYPGGPPEPPYDMAGWTLPMQMGVKRIAVNHPFESSTDKLNEIPFPTGQLSGSGDGYLVRAGRNDDFRLLNRLHHAGVRVQMTLKNDGNSNVPVGSFYIPDKKTVRDMQDQLLEGLSCILEGVKHPQNANLTDIPLSKLAVYRSWNPVIDEGWTRLVLDNFEFDYVSLLNADVRAGELHGRYDCIILPSQSVSSILEGYAPESTSPRYVGGIGSDGIVALQDFVRSGGTLVCIDESCNLPIESFNIPVNNLLKNKPSSEFFCPGSILRVSIDSDHPVGFGMSDWISGYFRRSQAFELINDETKDSADKEKKKDPRSPAVRFPATVIARYSDTVLLESGWIQGEDLIKDKPAIVEVKYGAGQIVLLGFRVQNRGFTHGTFRLLFNSIVRSTLRE